MFGPDPNEQNPLLAVRRVNRMRDLLRFEDAKLVVLMMALEHLARNVHATGLSYYVGCHFKARVEKTG